jgi:hypothetical protein
MSRVRQLLQVLSFSYLVFSLQHSFIVESFFMSRGNGELYYSRSTLAQPKNKFFTPLNFLDGNGRVSKKIFYKFLKFNFYAATNNLTKTQGAGVQVRGPVGKCAR